MDFSVDIRVSNPTHIERHDFVELDLARVKVPASVADEELHLYRLRDGAEEAVDFQIDYPFGRTATPTEGALTSARGHRVMTFFSHRTPAGTPPGPPQLYSEVTARTTFRLKTGPRARLAPRNKSLTLRHFYAREDESPDWDPSRPVLGVTLRNVAPDDKNVARGLEVYFSLIPRPLGDSPVNYTGGVTSLVHYRAHAGWGCNDVLSPQFKFGDYEAHKGLVRWGQLTRLDFYPTAWDTRWYTTIDLLADAAKKGAPDRGERRYSLVWSHAGPHRATVTLASEPFTVPYRFRPVLDLDDVLLTARLFRVISVHPGQECYTEQLIVRPEDHPNLSLAFRAHYLSHLDFPPKPEPQLVCARDALAPESWAVWWNWLGAPRNHQRNLGYGFASDSHVRSLNFQASDITWRLQLGHEHRCVHGFMFEPHGEFGPLHTVGHDWYLRLFKPLEVYPFTRYLERL